MPRLLKVIDCAYCDGKAVLTKEPIEIIVRGANYKILQWFYTCEKCNREFTDNKADSQTIAQIP